MRTLLALLLLPGCPSTGLSIGAPIPQAPDLGSCIVVAPSPLRFRDARVGQSTVLDLSIGSLCQQPVEWLGAAISGPNAADFSLEAGWPLPIQFPDPPFAFGPLLGLHADVAGVREATLDLTSDFGSVSVPIIAKVQ